ncbi:hypothetical protein HW555_007389, partial [Spodoptera exigua]
LRKSEVTKCHTALLGYVYLQSLTLYHLCHYCIAPRLKTHMRYAAQLPMIIHLSPSHTNHSAVSVYTHELMSVARRGSVITSLGSYSYHIGARLARRVFKIGTSMAPAIYLKDKQLYCKR